MSEDCCNYCTEPLLFPKKIENRPGLDHIDYRIGTYSDFREVLLRHLNKDQVLSAWTHREADDPGIALLEGASILSDILTFYQELYANETYLRTAQWRESIADLVRLLGYRLSPGVGGRATFAFEVKGDKPVVIPAGFPVQAQVEGAELPVDFETEQETVAYPSLSKFHLYRRLYTPENIEETTTEFYIRSEMPVALKKGDRLLIGDPVPVADPTRLEHGEIVIVDEVRELHGCMLFKIKGALKRTNSRSEIVAFKLGRSFRHFGHNTPRKFIKIVGENAQEETHLYLRPLSATTSSIESPTIDISGTTGVRIVDPNLDSLDFPLDNEVENLPNGNILIVQGLFFGWNYTTEDWAEPQEFTLIRIIKDVKALSMTWGSLSGATTLVTLNESLTTYDDTSRYYTIDIRRIQLHEVISPLLHLRAGLKETSLSQGTDLYFYGTDSDVQALKGRALLFEKPGKDPSTAYVVSVQSLSSDVAAHPALRRITLDHEVNYADFPNEHPLVTVYGNLAEATQGKTEKEAVLGNGDSRQIFQTFKLPKAPLTYHNTAGESPPEVPELKIYVNDRLWKRVSSLFGHTPTEEIYIVREDSNGDSWVQFGDGKTGARLPSGLSNIVAGYRTGIGAYGALKEETTVQPRGKLKRLAKVYLPGIASGGAQPESGDNAREAAPGKVQSLDRLVSLKDFENEALSIAGLSKVSAAWQLIENIPMVVLTVLMETGRDKEIEEVQRILNDYNTYRGPQRFPVTVIPGTRQYIYLDVSFGLHPAFREELVKNAIKEALGVTGEEGNGIDGSMGLFGLQQRRFGQNEYAASIAGTIQNVEGVVWVRVTAFDAFTDEAEDPAELSPPDPKPVSPAEYISCDNTHVLSLYTGHLQLLSVFVEPTEVSDDG